MGWQGYEMEIPVGMIFKKMYCHKCGNKLGKKKISQIVKKGEQDYSNDILGHGTIGMDRKDMVRYIYECSNCHFEITYKDQCVIAKKQKMHKKKILNDN